MGVPIQVSQVTMSLSPPQVDSIVTGYYSVSIEISAGFAGWIYYLSPPVQNFSVDLW